MLLGWIFYKTQAHKQLPHGHVWLRAADNPVFLNSTEKSQKLNPTELPNWEMSSFDFPATSPCAELPFLGGKAKRIWQLLPKASNLRSRNKEQIYVSFLLVIASDTRDSYLINKVNLKKNSSSYFLWRGGWQKRNVGFSVAEGNWWVPLNIKASLGLSIQIQKTDLTFHNNPKKVCQHPKKKPTERHLQVVYNW